MSLKQMQTKKRERKKKGMNLFLLLFWLGSGKPGVKIKESSPCPERGIEHTCQIIIDSFVEFTRFNQVQ